MTLLHTVPEGHCESLKQPGTHVASCLLLVQLVHTLPFAQSPSERHAGFFWHEQGYPQMFSPRHTSS